MNDYVEGVQTHVDPVAAFGLFKGPSKAVCRTSHQEQCLPIRHCPLHLRLELVNDLFEAAVVGDETSNGFVINNVQLRCDLITLDNSVANECAIHLFSGNPKVVSASTRSQQAITSPDVNINMQQSFTCLKAVFLSHWKANALPSQQHETMLCWNPLENQWSLVIWTTLQN